MANGLIVCGRNGKPKVTGVWGGRKAYQVRLAQEWESGYFRSGWTVYWRCSPLRRRARSILTHSSSIRERIPLSHGKSGAAKMIGYFNSRGVEVTSEFIYREQNSGLRLHWGKSDVIGLIPAFWNPVLSPGEILKYPASVVGFGEQCKALTPYKQLEWLIYGNLHGEDILLKHRDTAWVQEFLKRFITYTVPHYYLNQFERLKIYGMGRSRRLYHSGGVVSCVDGHRIERNGRVLKQGNNLCLPEVIRPNSYLAYSESGGEQTWYLHGKKAMIRRLTPDGVSDQVGVVPIINGAVRWHTQPESAWQIEVEV